MGSVRNGDTLRYYNYVLFLLGLLTARTQNNSFIKYIKYQKEYTSVKLVGYLILDIGYSILENFLSPAPHERSLSVMRYGLTNDTVF